MNRDVESNHGWVTAASDHAADTSPMELSLLVDELTRCAESRSRWFALLCTAEALHRFLARHLFTTLVVVALMIGGAYLLL